MIPTFPYGLPFAGYWEASRQLLPEVPPVGSGFWLIITAGTINDIFYPVGSILIYTVSEGFYKGDGMLWTWDAIQNVPETATRWASWDEVSAKPTEGEVDALVIRDSSGDVEARRYKSSTYSQSSIPSGSSVAFRVNATDDNYVRFASLSAFKAFLGAVSDSALFSGYTLDEVLTKARRDLVRTTLTINNKPLTSNIVLTSADVGLPDVANYAPTSSFVGTSTTHYATQKAAHDAAGAPLLADNRKRAIHISSTAPTGSDGANGDVWLVI